MAVTALVLYALWFALAFGLRSLMALRRTEEPYLRRVHGAPMTATPRRSAASFPGVGRLRAA